VLFVGETVDTLAFEFVEMSAVITGETKAVLFSLLFKTLLVCDFHA